MKMDILQSGCGLTHPRLQLVFHPLTGAFHSYLPCLLHSF